LSRISETAFDISLFGSKVSEDIYLKDGNFIN